MPTPPPSPPVSGVEAVCSALGQACVCSEPLNVAQALSTGFNDPQDSPDESECANGYTVELDHGGETVPAFDMPAGITATSVWRIEYAGTYTIAGVNGTPVTLEQGALCTRMYQRLSDDYPLMGGSDNAPEERNKMLQLSGPWGFFQTEFWPPSADAEFNPRGSLPSGHRFHFTRSGERVFLADCKSSWCRVEQCVDHNGTETTMRTRVTVIDTGKTAVHVSDVGTVEGPMYMEVVWIGNLYRQQVTDGSRYISHAIQTLWPQADGQWIGAACEVEGESDWADCN